MPAWLGILMVAALLAVGLWWRPVGEGLPTTPDREAAPRYVVEGAHWQRFDADGAPSIIARAHVLRAYADERLELGALTVEQLGQSDAWRLQAPSGSVPPGGERLRLDAPVSAEAGTGDSALALVAGPVWIDRMSRTLQSDAPVTVTAPQRHARALGWSADWEARRLTLRDHVEVTYALR